MKLDLSSFERALTSLKRALTRAMAATTDEELRDAWFEFRKARNLTSHAYDRAEAEAIFNTLPTFVLAAEELLSHLQQGVARL